MGERNGSFREMKNDCFLNTQKKSFKMFPIILETTIVFFTEQTNFSKDFEKKILE